eukprot:CAMPEP_0118894696 /NCGR_PEP_ID=MMETSP1166-20130328/3365_1 /TAXON_ID=1104430 /ORGANISM="Chrysoreinhardia sp, Strain CCMP3193" /LENGTH=57 /DNA_ID=CAMNT_0006833635 /DNA_START=62 /DNA_END=232 /DNA_ORIENTATION=-
MERTEPVQYDAEDWKRDELKERLSALTTGLTELRRKENLLLEEKNRVARARKAPRRR